MPRISALTIQQVNQQLDVLDNLRNQISDLQNQHSFLQHQVAISDPIHAPITTNNLNFTWTGGSATLSWPKAFIKDKNWNVQTLSSPTIKSSAKGHQHLFTIPAGSLSLLPSTYYWIGWDHVHQKMLANTDASLLHSNYNVHLICQVFTGTAGQTGVAGGGGSTGGSDLSGSRYKNF